MPCEATLLASKHPVLELRARIVKAIRRFFEDEGFLEVNTPVMTAAPAPEPYIDAIGTDDGHFLITSPELYMKRLLAAGYERIFQITPAFRRGEQGRFHHPEFTLLEWYRAGSDYETLQDDCRRLLTVVCQAVGRLDPWEVRGRRLQITGDWGCFTVHEAFRIFAGWEPSDAVDQTRFDQDLVEKVEPHLGFPTPCILKDYPAGQAALARLKPGDASVAERFELYWNGLELANGFSELTDGDVQGERFREALEERERLGLRTYPWPQHFLDCMPLLPQSCAGIALGVDRLVLLLAGATHLDDVSAFPPELI